MIRRDDKVLTVDAEIANYCIEPIRFELGFTRVEMVDDHLKRLAVDQRAYSADSDALLEARGVFLLEEQHPEVSA